MWNSNLFYFNNVGPESNYDSLFQIQKKFLEPSQYLSLENKQFFGIYGLQELDQPGKAKLDPTSIKSMKVFILKKYESTIMYKIV